MKKRKDQELTPWAKYQRDHGNRSGEQSKGRNRHFSSRKPKSKNRITKPKKGAKSTKQISTKFKVLIGTILVVMILMISYFLSPISRIQNVQVVGNKRISTTEIKKNLSFKKGDLIIGAKLKKGMYENQLLKKDSAVKNAAISVSTLGNVQVKIQENAVLGYVIRNKMYYTIKQDSSVVKKSSKQPTGKYPIFRGFKSDALLKKFLKEYAQMPNEVQNDVAEVKFSPAKNEPERIHFFMNDGNQVYAIINTFAKKMKYYPEISASMKKRGTIDLQVGAYSRPYGWTDEAKEESQSNSLNTSNSDYEKEQQAATQTSSKPNTDETSVSSTSFKTDE